jgi:MFS family permease
LALPLALLTFLSFPGVAAEATPGEPTAPNRVSLARIAVENKILIGIYMLMFLTNMMLYANVVFLPTTLEQIGTANPRVIGLHFSIMGLASGIAGLLYRRIKSDRPHVLMAVTALVLWIVGFAVIFFSLTLIMVALGLAVLGAGFGIMMPTVMVWVGSIGPPTHRGTISSYLGTFGYLGQFLSPILFAPVLMIGQPKDIFLAAGLICVLFFVVFFSVLRIGAKQTTQTEV